MKWKIARILNVIGISVLISGLAVGAGVGIYYAVSASNQDSSNPNNNSNTRFQYNNTMRRITRSGGSANNEQPSIGDIVLDFYSNNTRAIVFTKPISGNKLELVQGTIWNVPKQNIPESIRDNNRYYFATNIHVINEWLSEQSSIFPNYKQKSVKAYFGNKPDEYNQAQNTDIINYSHEIKDLRLEKIAIHENENIDNVLLNGYSGNKKMYSDFAILSTTKDIFNTKKPNNNQEYESITENNDVYDFIDTREEWERVINNKNQSIYLCGFPSNGTNANDNMFYDYVTIEYSLSSTYLSTAKKMMGEYYFSKSGLTIQGEKYLSFSHQLIMPNMTIPGGSSGSLITVIDENKVKPLGIWWGEYSSSNNTIVNGSMDFFYTPDYKYNGEKLNSYNLLDINDDKWIYKFKY